MTAQAEDALIRRILAVTLTPEHASSQGEAPIIHLTALAQELQQELKDEAALLNRELLDRVIVTRLLENAPSAYPQLPLQYLLGCYARANSEIRSSQVSSSEALRATVQACRELIISYTGLLLIAGVVPQPEEAEARGALQLLDSWDATNSAPKPGVVPLPPGFLEEFSARHEHDGLAVVLEPIIKELASRMARQSPLGAYAAPLAAVHALVTIPAAARTLVALPSFLPDLKKYSGRAIQLPSISWLGACFCVSPMLDEVMTSTPNVQEQCFSGLSNRRQGDVAQSVAALRITMKHVHGEVTAICKALLSKDTRERMLTWFAAVIEGNMERAKMQLRPEVAASHGFFINLDAVLLKLCGPFLAGGSNFWQRVDVRFVASNPRVSFGGDTTKLAATAEEEHAWQEERRRLSQATGSSTGPERVEYHFICECFFMTIKALKLGVVKVINDTHDDMRRMQELIRATQEIEALIQRSAGGPQEQLMQGQLVKIKAMMDTLQAARMCTETVLGDPDFLGDILTFYRLLAAWLLRLVCPNGMPSLPLPEQVPRDWATLPEYFVEDIVDVLLYVSRVHPEVLPVAGLDDIMVFLTVFMASPAYVRSTYLRSKLSEVITVWLPQPEGHSQRGLGHQRGAHGAASALAHVFEGHPLVLEHITPTMLQLYVDIESSDRGNQFYTKFQMRQLIGDVLQYLWSKPQHRQAWKKFAAQNGWRGPYLRFANMLINDSMFLLNESLSKLKDLKEHEKAQGDVNAWAALPPQERQEREAALAHSGDQLRSLLYLAHGTVNTLCYSSAEVYQPLLLPEMVGRIAENLNYFLNHLAGPHRKNLSVKNPEKYNFKPRELLHQIVQIYLHLAATDRQGVFVRAVAADERSYRPAVLLEAGKVLRQLGELSELESSQLEALAVATEAAASKGAEEEEEEGDVPDEFLDATMYSRMVDPVLLPTSGMVMDRAIVNRHLLSDQRDPFNRKPLTPDQLQPLPELRTRIEAWVAERRRVKSNSGAANMVS